MLATARRQEPIITRPSDDPASVLAAVDGLGAPARPIVLVHGTRTSSAIWAPQVAELERRGHATHAIDLPDRKSVV